jgi:hypothetical protein
MAITPITEYTGDVPIIGQPQPTFNQNVSDKLNYDKQLFGAGGGFNVAISEINQTASQVSSDASSASQSASNALASEVSAEASASATGYQGLWPDSGGSALLGDTYQTQVGGVPTGKYFSALKNTSVSPVDDNENWRLLISTSSLEDSTKVTMNKYGLSGKAPVPSVAGDFDLITEENYHSLSITGVWNNTPFGDSVSIGGQLSILRRAFYTGAVIQELHLTNGDLYRRVGSGNPVIFGNWRKAVDSSTSQFDKYDQFRVYSYGDVAYTESSGKKSFWQWYSNVESLAGKDPLNTANRRVGWSDTTKPFYWKPYTAKVSGETMAWDDDNLPEIMMVAAGQQVSALTYHTLAAAKPQWIDDVDPNLLNIPDRQGRFTRAADGTTWIASQTHEDDIKSHYHTMNDTSASGTDVNSSPYADTGNGVIDDSDLRTNSTGGNETMPKGYIEWIGYAL